MATSNVLVDSTNVRIVTTLGHVDHGKTTLMDALLAANNIISPRMAGKMRYLDSREDEQVRGITMEASSVALKFQVMGKDANGEKAPRNYLVNFIDTPGHVDFSSEVSTASRLCDGALVLVDVVEGVCTQTIAVLRQAWQDRLKPILVINKFDRLITELKLSPVEGYHHLARLIEQVNAVMGNFFASERMDDDLRWREERDRRLAEKKDAAADETDAKVNESEEFQEKDDEDIYFAPEKGNVIFASAIDGWGFRIGKFAQLYAQKLGMKEGNLRRVLWGDYFLDPKTKKVISYKHLRGRAMKPLFVQFVLENIWAVYDATVINTNPDKVAKIVSALDLKILPRDLRSKDTRHLLSLIFTQWLSLSTCIIQTVIDIVPPPTVAQATRLAKMIYPNTNDPLLTPKNKLEEDLYSSNSSPTACVCAYVSKMFAVSSKDLPENRKRSLTADEMRNKGKEARAARLAAEEAQEPKDPSPVTEVTETPPAPTTDTPKEEEEVEVALGFARLYSGTLKQGASLFALLPKYNTDLGPTHPSNKKYILTVKVEGLYIMMGRELVPVPQVNSGNVFAIRGLESKVWRSATLCAPTEAGVSEAEDTAELEAVRSSLINLGAVHRAAAPIVRVALEPKHPADMPKIVAGLKLLSQSDPCVETFQQQTGEHVILTAGELHLERCLKDLRERFAKVEIQASVPLVPYRETAVKAPDMAPTKTAGAPRGTIIGQSTNGVVMFTIRAIPLPRKLLQFVLENISVLKALHRSSQEGISQEEVNDVVDNYGEIIQKATTTPELFWDALGQKCKEAGGEWVDVVDRVWSFGPQRAGSCLLIDNRKSRAPVSLRRRLERTKEDGGEIDKAIQAFDNNLETGFQLATFQGPLCAEPIQGLAYFVEEVNINREALEKEIEQNKMSQITGSLISSVRDSCRNGLLDWSPRLMLAMYSCEIQCSTDVLGKVYGVVAKRRGRIVAEEMKEGTSFFSVSALLPVAESFGFADDIRTRTSGAASPQLIFSGYELLDLDPFWVPKTEEELEDLGEKADRINIAKVYVDGVRSRKGMFVDKKIVEFAEKQRTLKR